MSDSKVIIQLKVVATHGDRKYEESLIHENGLRINGFRLVNRKDIEDALKRFLLRNCDDEEILNALATSDNDKRQMAYNPNLSHEMADNLADELCKIDDGGAYPYDFCKILSNSCLSKEKLDYFANRFLQDYKRFVEENEGSQNYDLIYLLRYIAQNPNVSEDTLETLKCSNIPMIVEAASR